MSIRLTESVVEAAALAWLALGYAIVPGPEFVPDAERIAGKCV